MAKFKTDRPTLKQQKECCYCFNSGMSLDGFGPGQRVFATGCREHVKANPNIETLKGVTVTLTKRSQRKPEKPDKKCSRMGHQSSFSSIPRYVTTNSTSMRYLGCIGDRP